MSYQSRSTGAYTHLAQLASYQMAARHLPLQKRAKALSHLFGPYKSPNKGRGMEFEDVRQYQAGDDIRTIDWRVTARTGKAHTKQFREEREKPVLIAVDQRQQMFFGSQIAMKSVQACDIAAYIAWAALAKGDRVGGHIFHDKGHEDIRPKAQRKTVLRFLNALVSHNSQLSRERQHERQSIADALLELKRIAKPGSQIYIISDFHDFDENCIALLHDLIKHCEIFAIKIYDPLEQQLPNAGRYTASNGQQKFVINSSSRQKRDSYEKEFEQQFNAQKQLFAKYQLAFIPVSTVDNPIDVLQQYLGGRKQ